MVKKPKSSGEPTTKSKMTDDPVISGNLSVTSVSGGAENSGNGHSSDEEGSKATAGSSVYNVQPFDFVVVEFYVPQTKRFKYFIAKVTHVNSDFYKVVFLQHHKSNFFWPDFMDERNILPTQVRRILAPPAQKGEDIFHKTEICDLNFK